MRGRSYGFSSVAHYQLGNLQMAWTLAQATVTAAPDQRLLVKITGKKQARVKASATRYFIRRTAYDANGHLVLVEVRDTRPPGRKSFRSAKGPSRGTYSAALRPGRNSIETRAVDAASNRSATPGPQ